MRSQLFVSRRHAGHDHGGGGRGVRAPAKVSLQARAPLVGEGSSPVSTDDEVIAAHGAPLAVERTVEIETLPTLARGSAEGGLVYFDAPSGAGGDMLVASLIDLGVPWSVITGAVEALGLHGVRLDLRRGHSGALSGLRFVVDIDAQALPGQALEGQATGERSYAQIRELISSSRLARGVVERSLRVFERLARAESRAHHVPVEDVHFHEVGGLDSIVDIVGVCAALEYVGGSVWCSPLPLGRGFVTCRHGVIPLPSPAAVECLLGLQTYDAGIDKELVTPTAAAVLGALTAGCGGWPTGVLAAVGWGRGSMVLPDRPNLIRAVVVRPAPQPGPTE
jgi:pyridinium-3,5-bisthiocarboxylic acid mononucleotide nickel chelatase